jgi:hypothetical protein
MSSILLTFFVTISILWILYFIFAFFLMVYRYGSHFVLDPIGIFILAITIAFLFSVYSAGGVDVDEFRIEVVQ